MARKITKIEKEEDNIFDLFAQAGITVESIDVPSVNSKKDVKKTLLKQRGFIRVLRTEAEVNKYFYQCYKNGIVAVDTETNNSLDVHLAEMIGLCLYTPYNRPVYIPIGHRDKSTGELQPGQVSKEFLKSKIQELTKIKCVFHNAKFDVNVIRFNFGIQLPIYWDTLIGSKILDENRLTNGLKFLYVEGIDPCMVDYHVTTFFDENVYADILDFGLYSAMDAYDTYKVYLKQLKELSTPSMSKLKKLLEDLEFKVTEVCADMEFRGFTFDRKLCENYFKTETAKLKAMGEKINKLLEPYRDKIEGYQSDPSRFKKVPKLDEETGLPVMKKKKVVVESRGRTFTKWEETNEPLMIENPYSKTKMEWPVKLTSPDQVLCLLNCILNVPCASTVVDSLKATGNEIADLIGKYRHQNHNLTSFFDPYLKLARGNVMYATFNQMGGAAAGEEEGKDDDTVKTGRFSSKNPNLQQCPARQQEDGARLCYTASPGKSLIDNDFSAQEPRIMSSLSGERELIDGYNLRTAEFPKGKDFYAMLASSAFKRDYWDCTEFDREGKYSAEGKARRQAGKVIQLGVSYGMGVKLLVEGINKKKGPNEDPMTIEDGEAMMTDFFGKFKNLKIWKDYNMARLEQFGYMETAMGRRRRLYDTWLPDYRVRVIKEEPIEDIFFGMNLILFSNPEDLKDKSTMDMGPVIRVTDKEATEKVLKQIEKNNVWRNKEYVEELKKNPLYKIKSNGGFKSRPKTQATNFVIQGGGAELTKKAMVALYRHPDRERLGLNILAPVHDEIICECYTELREEGLKVLAGCMAATADGVYEVKMAGDGVIETRWNLEHFVDHIQKDYKKNGGDLQAIYDANLEVDEDCLRRMATGEFDPQTDLLIPRENCI